MNLPPSTKSQLDSPDQGRTLVAAGLGNIGGPFLGMVARMPWLGRIILIDRDVYEIKNLSSQPMSPEDVGRPKVAVQAERLQRLRPELIVTPLQGDLANIPLGCLQSDLIVAGLDSLEARVILNQAAWRLGVPWLDGGVEPELMLARINGYLPGHDLPCFECALDEADYQQRLSNPHPCQLPMAGDDASPTNGSPGLGALVGALLAIECDTFFSGRNAPSLFGRQTIYDPVHHKQYLTSFQRNPHCRFCHETWCLLPLPDVSLDCSLGETLLAASQAVAFSPAAALGLEEHPFVGRLRCLGCGYTLERWHVAGRLRARDKHCPHCATRELLPAGFDMIEAVDAASPAPLLGQSLRALGMSQGDVFTLRDEDRVCHLVIKRTGL